jgi:FtsH-binding integral membrane protein
LSPLARYLVWAKVTLIVFGVVLVFVEIPSGTLIYPIAGLVVFAGLTLFDSALRRAVCTVVWAAFAN